MIAETSKKVGLEINVQKTKILRINAKSQEPISIGDQILEDVTYFEYLGSKLDEVGGRLSELWCILYALVSGHYNMCVLV